jgi:peptide/nickel transport system permease protein
MTNKTVNEIKNGSTIGKRKSISRRQDAWIRMKNNKFAVIGMFVFGAIILMGIIAPFVVDYEQDVITPQMENRFKSPNVQNWLGTDALGRDMFSRLVYGTRISLFVSLSAVVLSVTVGVIIGSVAGYFGGNFDLIIMRFIDIFASIPSLLLSITIAAALGQSIGVMILAIGVAGIPALTRTVRATVLSIRKQDYVLAGTAMGGNSWQIITFHLLPNCIAPIIVQGTLRISSAILQCSSLSFLGVGVKPPMPEWGNMLSEGRNFMRQAGYLTIIPGLTIMITVMAVNLMGDGLRDALDPRMKR